MAVNSPYREAAEREESADTAYLFRDGRQATVRRLAELRVEWWKENGPSFFVTVVLVSVASMIFGWCALDAYSEPKTGCRDAIVWSGFHDVRCPRAEQVGRRLQQGTAQALECVCPRGDDAGAR